MIKGTHPYSYKTEEWALITGVKVMTTDNCCSRPVFECQYKDGFVNYIPISDIDNYEIKECG